LIKYLLDTNVFSELIKTVPNISVFNKVEQHKKEIATASVVWHELHYGCYRLPVSRKRRLIESFLNDVIRQHIVILPYDEKSATWHASERARLSNYGKTPSFTDGQIASTAKTDDLILITRNVSDFSFFSDLTVINWHEESDESV